MSVGEIQKTEFFNPKDFIGSTKPSLTKIPATALTHCAIALMDGASKYDPYNWRDKKINASIYIDAVRRHLDAWFEREEYAEDSGVHHLGHAMAGLAILLDAIESGELIDDRPKSSNALGRIYKNYQPVITKINERAKKRREQVQSSCRYDAYNEHTGEHYKKE